MRVHGTSAVVVSVVCVVVCLLSQCAVEARMLHDDKPTHDGPNALSPNYCIFEHNIGKFVMAINNNGTFGVNYAQTANIDCFTQLEVQSCEYPKGARTVYMYGAAFWIGAIAGRDTLVTVGADGWQQMYEMHPDEGALGQVLYRSTIASDQSEREGAVSEQDFIARYTDTCTSRCSGTGFSQFDQRSHLPIGIEVTQRSYAWSYAYAEDIILFDYTIRNITNQRLQDVYMGIYVDADVCDLALLEEEEGFADDICGFRQKAPAAYLPSYCDPDSDIVNLAWIADNDGDFGTPYTAVPNITAARIVRTPSDSLEVSFNWWVGNELPAKDFGPQARASYRNLGTGGTGTPEGDANKYHFLSNREFDYDQIKTSSIAAGDSIWLSPPAGISDSVTDGYDTRYLLSFGPFDIDPGESLPLSFAYIAGEGFHIDPNNGDNLRTGDWERYYEGVSFADLDANSTWADWIYDNPGYDTDSDSYMGEYTVCNLGDDSTLAYDTTVDSNVTPWDTTVDTYWAYDVADTIWRKGDGVPDFRGAAPPPAPATYISPISGKSGLRVEPVVGGARVIWNGAESENVRDVFSREYDFEGYRVHLARDSRLTSYSVLTSYDKEDYNKWEWDFDIQDFVLLESPYSLEELQALYSSGDTTWHPLDYPRSRPFVNPSDPDEIFFFTPQDFNRSVLANDQVNATTEIRKVYPDAAKPPTASLDSLPDSLYSEYVTDDGFLKYYEYELVIENLLPTVPWWINVTAFDYGSPRSGLSALETNPTVLPIVTYALESTEKVLSEGLEVFVYPNPYRFDADYRDRGFEGRIEKRGNERVRAIHFANLPPKCDIRIFTLDGDLIREIVHDLPIDDPRSNHDEWDLITRNTQQVVSGLYYWTVEDDQGNVQIGKLVIIF